MPKKKKKKGEKKKKKKKKKKKNTPKKKKSFKGVADLAGKSLYHHHRHRREFRDPQGDLNYLGGGPTLAKGEKTFPGKKDRAGSRGRASVPATTA